MKKFAVLIGNEVAFNRVEFADTLLGIKRKQTQAEGDGNTTQLVDTTITTIDNAGDKHYAEIDRSGNQIGWRNARAIDE